MKLGYLRLSLTVLFIKTQNTKLKNRIRIYDQDDQVLLQTGIIFVYFVSEEEVKSLTENDHITYQSIYIIFET